MPEPTLGSLFDDTSRLDWPNGAQLRHNAQRRARRTAIVRTALVVVAVVAVILGANAVGADRRAYPPVPGYPSSSPVPTSDGPSGSAPDTGSGTASPGRTAASPTSALTSLRWEAFLQAEDAGPGQWIVQNAPDTGDWSVAYVLSRCPARPSAGPGVLADLDSNVRDIARPPNGASERVFQEVSLFGPGGANATYDWYRTGVDRCTRFADEGGDGSAITMKIVASGFAGQRSMLVELAGGGRTTLYAFVVRERLMTQMIFTPKTEENGKRLARLAAARMCAAQGGC